MYPSVQSRFRDFNKTFEDDVPYMYADLKGLVTVGVGNLVDPVSLALSLPFRFKAKPASEQKVSGVAGAPATREQITAEWQRVKGATKSGLNSNGDAQTNVYAAGHYERLTDLELTSAAIGNLVNERLASNESILLKTWPEFAKFTSWPADGQLGLLSLAWAFGPGKTAGRGFSLFHEFRKACAVGDFAAAGAESHIRDSDNPGVTPRNDADSILFSNAARVVADPKSYLFTTLYYPMTLR